MGYVKIPKSFQVGGQDMEVRMVERCEKNYEGLCYLGAGYIEIADTIDRGDKQSEGSKRNTFFHELIHSILDTMGETELSANEKFVNCFAGFLTEAMADAYFKEVEDECNQ